METASVKSQVSSALPQSGGALMRTSTVSLSTSGERSEFWLCCCFGIKRREAFAGVLEARVLRVRSLTFIWEADSPKWEDFMALLPVTTLCF